MRFVGWILSISLLTLPAPGGTRQVASLEVSELVARSEEIVGGRVARVHLVDSMPDEPWERAFGSRGGGDGRGPTPGRPHFSYDTMAEIEVLRGFKGNDARSVLFWGFGISWGWRPRGREGEGARRTGNATGAEGAPEARFRRKRQPEGRDGGRVPREIRRPETPAGSAGHQEPKDRRRGGLRDPEQQDARRFGDVPGSSAAADDATERHATRHSTASGVANVVDRT